MFTTRGTTGRSVLDHDFKRITRTFSNPSQQSIILKQERVVSSMEIDNSRRSSFSEIRTAEFVSYCKDQDLNKQITGNKDGDGDGEYSYLDDTEEELEEEVAVGMAYMSSSTTDIIENSINVDKSSTNNAKEKAVSIISDPSDDVMEGLLDPQTAEVIDSMPSDNRGDVGDFELGEFNDDDTQNLEENGLQHTLEESATNNSCGVDNLKYVNDTTENVTRNDTSAGETNKLTEKDDQSSGESARIIDLNKKFNEKIEMIERAFIDGTMALRTALIAFRDLMELLPRDIQQRISESSGNVNVHEIPHGVNADIFLPSSSITTVQETPNESDTNISDENFSAPSQNVILTPKSSSPSSDGPNVLLTPEPERPNLKRKGKQIESQDEKRRAVNEYSPKRPRSAFNYFTQDIYSSGGTAHVSPKDRFKFVRKKWKEMPEPEKDKYLEMAYADRKRYERESASKELRLRHDKPSEGERELLYVLVPTPTHQVLSAYQDYRDTLASSSTTSSNQLGQSRYEGDINTTNDTAETDNIVQDEGSTSVAINHSSNNNEVGAFVEQETFSF
ncbi:27936_t:CDS:2 [Dentiscutata erythropus]|uniref:27936_t:CDS:1 n=1 Tax=Dentiscutata erythropus TaxID=1348616 RepID=A0A9N9D7Q2_9GLOM|nr:27936_t:CDS:2 [Dentiscutata erythropus]